MSFDLAPRDRMVSVRGISKSYNIREGETKPTTLAEAVLQQLRNPFGPSQKKTFWAIQDLSFEIGRGEVVGIIGRNGAGKSTLLKILSRITSPSLGAVDLYGTVGSLLEVGTGFHPELTGRENVYLNGQILGMRRKEVDRQFDAIVDFAGVERFLDTPVKRYSSGMYVRLAFAVAAHLNPDILIVDEVLAVGDANFQKKCLGKLEDVSKSGRTVLFVSHSMQTILRLCKRVILLKNGSAVPNLSPEEAVRFYLQSGAQRPAERIWGDSDPWSAPGDGTARLRAVRVLDRYNKVSESINIYDDVEIEVQYDHHDASVPTAASVHIINDDGICLFASNDFTSDDWRVSHATPGRTVSRCTIPGNYLSEGRHFVLAAICSYNPNVVHALERDAVCFNVQDPGDGAGTRGPFAGTWPGVVRPKLKWSIGRTPF